MTEAELIKANVCETCGKPATSVVADVKELPGFTIDSRGLAWKQVEPAGDHFFCDEHSRPARKLTPLPSFDRIATTLGVIRIGNLEVTCNGPSVRDWSVKVDGVARPVKRLVITLDVDHAPPVVEMTWYPNYEFEPGAKTLRPIVPKQPEAPPAPPRRGREFI